MESLESAELSVQNVVVCENCQSSQNAESKFCPSCSFPIQGTDEAKRIFRLDVGIRKRLLKESEDEMKTAKKTIYVAAVIFFASGFIQYMINDDFPTLIVNLIVSLVFLILAAWGASNAFGAILTAFVIYMTLQVVNVVVDPATLFQGIIIKVMIIAAFGKGIQSGLKARDLTKQLEKYKAVPVGNN
jgi:hypothetical protein